MAAKPPKNHPKNHTTVHNHRAQTLLNNPLNAPQKDKTNKQRRPSCGKLRRCLSVCLCSTPSLHWVLISVRRPPSTPLNLLAEKETRWRKRWLNNANIANNYLIIVYWLQNFCLLILLMGYNICIILQFLRFINQFEGTKRQRKFLFNIFLFYQEISSHKSFLRNATFWRWY